MLHRLLLLGVVLVIMIVASTSPRERRPMAYALGIATFVFAASAVRRADDAWVLLDAAGLVVCGWLIRDMLGARPWSKIPASGERSASSSRE